MSIMLPERVRALKVSVFDRGGAMGVSEIEVGLQRRHLSKKLTGTYDTRLDTGSLREVFPGHSASWVYNGPDDDYPMNPKLLRWTVPGTGFYIWGSAIIHGMAAGKLIDCTLTVQQVAAALGVFDSFSDRVSSRLQAL